MLALECLGNFTGLCEEREEYDEILRCQFGTSSIGASLKDLGKKWFAFSKMDEESFGILERLK